MQDLYASSALSASIIPTTSLAESSFNSIPSRDGQSPNILLQPPTTEEIAGYFALINPLKYSQPHQPIPSPFSPPLNGLTITAYNAGHTLGGTIWHIQHGLESIVYAVDWNQAKENVTSGAAWLGGSGGGAEVIEQLRKPTALVCSSKGAERLTVAGGRKNRDDALLKLVADTVKAGGTVLIPSDSSARILELAYILEHHWRHEYSGPHSEQYRDAKVCLAGRSASATLRYARSMIEWMDEGIVREMEAAIGREKAQSRSKDQNDNKKRANQDDQTPFDFRHVKLLERKSQVQRALSGGKPGVILASDSSLEWGFAKDALKQLCSDPRNLVILTERISKPLSSRKGIGRSLWEIWEQHVETGSEQDLTKPFHVRGVDVKAVEVETARLEGDETLLYQQYLARRRQMHSTLQGDNTLTSENAAEIADDRSSTTSESSEDSDNEHQGRALNISATMTQSKRKMGLTDEELGVNVLLRRKNVYDYNVRGKRGREKMFPFVARRNRVDDFGEMIRPEEYLRAEERDDTDGQDLRDEPKKETTVGQKRKWDDVATQNQRSSKGANKRTKGDARSDDAGKTRMDEDGADKNDDDGSSESEESDYEPEETIPEGPHKAVFREETIHLDVQIAHIDFSGLHEKRDLQMLIPLIKPRKLILVAGEEQETLSLAQDCRALLASEAGDSPDVFSPIIGETIDASVDTNAWTLKLSRSLVKKLAWQDVKGLSVVAVTGRLGAVVSQAADKDSNDETARKKLKLIKGEESDPKADSVETQPILDVVAANPTTSLQLVSQPLHVGDLRLADLRRLMQASGHTAEFRGEGTLLVDGSVVVRKSGTGRIEVEGGGYVMPGSRSQQYEGAFFALRRKIYEGLAVVAGG